MSGMYQIKYGIHFESTISVMTYFQSQYQTIEISDNSKLCNLRERESDIEQDRDWGRERERERERKREIEKKRDRERER